MNWIHDCFEKYRFQLWTLGCADEKALVRFLTKTYIWSSKKHIQAEILDKIISKNPKYAYYYAYDIIRGPWPPGEKAIASDPKYACCYALDIIKGPWPSGENTIASIPEYAYYYAFNIIKGPWPPGEQAITTDPYLKWQYELEFGVRL